MDTEANLEGNFLCFRICVVPNTGAVKVKYKYRYAYNTSCIFSIFSNRWEGTSMEVLQDIIFHFPEAHIQVQPQK